MWQRQKKCSSEDEESGIAGCRHGFDTKQAASEQAAYKHATAEQTLGKQSRWQDEYADDITLFRRLKESLGGYFLLSVYLALLIIPVYAIVMSAIKRDWLMMVIDTLLIPVGFIHGILMLFGVV
jgi:hypothetical protein